ncbi:response regulator transcription factor [Candidatus Oscillochloris fontis]|uniref:response regulator transcription factor n=1 Tax=Candidatus Oscillochloris fontis TaxID=2496868 RepID=UPI00101D43E6|nr:response regulator transcription factor [Candidatus Oscillochloris fontis]
MPQRILIVDDVREIVQGLAAYFRQAGFETLAAYDGRSALDLARRERPDLIILDWMMPELDGLEVCRQLRRDSAVPIIMLTARIEETDTLIGLELGADDYIAKPFRAREVVARARAILRRASGALAPSSMLRGAGLSLDLDRHTAEVDAHPVDLTPTEFAILVALMRNAGRPLSRAQILDAAQGDTFEGYERTIDAHIKNLRRKIETDPATPRRILTVFGVGYKFAAAE